MVKLQQKIQCAMSTSHRRESFHAHHIGGQLVTGQIFHIFMVFVDDFCEFTAVHRLFEHPHVHCGLKLVILGCVGAHNLGNGRAPEDMETQTMAYCFPRMVKCPLCFSVISKLYMDFNAFHTGLWEFLKSDVVVQRY